jgi:hypothetical protein
VKETYACGFKRSPDCLSISIPRPSFLSLESQHRLPIDAGCGRNVIERPPERRARHSALHRQ